MGVILDCLFKGTRSTLTLFEMSHESKSKPVGHSVIFHRISWQKFSVYCPETSKQGKHSINC